MKTEDEAKEQGERLAEARRKRGFSDAKAAATYFGWNYNTYSQHERGERGLRPKVAEKYGSAFKVRASWLMLGDDQAGKSSAPPDLIRLSRNDFTSLCRRLVHRLDTMNISGMKAAGDVGITPDRIHAFRHAAMNIETAEIPDLDRNHMDALATRLGTNLDWLVYGKGDENSCKEPLELQEVFRKLREAGPETWRQVNAFLEALKANTA